jgi:transcriptional regulator with XRE-family HTH domain
VWATVFPNAYTNEAFGPALGDLLAQRKMSQRAFALKIPVHQTTMSRFISGAMQPDMAMIERIAAAARVNPAYFVEYRAKLIGDAVCTVLRERPNMGITAYRYLKHGAAALQQEVDGDD